MNQPLAVFKIGDFVELDPSSLQTQLELAGMEWGDGNRYLFEIPWKGQIIATQWVKEFATEGLYSGWIYLVKEFSPNPDGFCEWVEQEILRFARKPQPIPPEELHRYYLEIATRGCPSYSITMPQPGTIRALMMPDSATDLLGPAPTWLLIEQNPELIEDE